MSSLPPGRSDRRKDLAWLALFAALLFVPFLGARDLWNPNEPLYGRAVVEMSRDGAWLIPTVNDVPFDEKPPLYFWLARIAALGVGTVDEATLRLPSAAAGIAGTVLVYLLVVPYAGRMRARVAAVVYATTFAVFWSARAVQMDLLLALFVLAAVVAASRVLDHGRSPLWGYAVVGICAGLGLLTKGPVVLICLAAALAGFAVGSGSRLARWARRGSGSGWLVGFVCFVAVALPWYLALWLAGETEFLRELIVRQNLTRFVDPWDHAEPWWYFLQYFWIDMAPWALFVPLALRLPDRDDDERRLDRLAWSWILITIGFFSLSASKRSPYILPVAPAVAILASGVMERLIHGTLGTQRRAAMQAVLGLLGSLLIVAAAFVVFSLVPRYPGLASRGHGAALVLVAGGVAVLCGLLLRGRNPGAAPAALLACVVTLYGLGAAWILPSADRYKSARPFCEQASHLVGPQHPLHSYRFWKWRASYVYYCDRTIPRLQSAEELRAYWNRDEQVWLLVERWMVDEVRGIVGPVEPKLASEVGANAVYLFTNR